MPVQLTDSAINKASRETAAKGRRDLADESCPGLRLRLTANGAKSWVLACRDKQGKMRRFRLGSYPSMGISLARKAAKALHVEVLRGADPIAEKRKTRTCDRAALAGIGTLRAILDVYTDQRGGKLKSWRESRKRVETVFRLAMDKPAESLHAADLQTLADAYASASSASFAVRTIRPALKWAAEPARAYIRAELAVIRPPQPLRRRKRVLSRDELGAILPVLRATTHPFSAALMFMLLTLARRQEVAQARWRDIDINAGTWSIPETKNGQPHVVPLSRQARAMLTALRPENADAAALVFHTASGRALGNWDARTKAVMRVSGTSGWTRHDLRRTGATMLGEMGEIPDIIEAALNHVSIRSPLAATYNRSRYRPQVAMALQRLADALDGIRDGAANVLPLRAG